MQQGIHDFTPYAPNGGGEAGGWARLALPCCYPPAPAGLACTAVAFFLITLCTHPPCASIPHPADQVRPLER
ncbi:UNVERIFIED_CONTAM: hypothetical protein K2H54_054092 [Gekko kuhli]